MSRENQAETLDGWERLAVPLTANAAQFPNLEEDRLQFMQIIARVRELITQQAALTASKQDVSKQLEALVVDGRKLATLLRTALRQKLGNRSEKLLEFGLQPLRSRSRKQKTGPPPEVRPPASSSPTDSEP